MAYLCVLISAIHSSWHIKGLNKVYWIRRELSPPAHRSWIGHNNHWILTLRSQDIRPGTILPPGALRSSCYPSSGYYLSSLCHNSSSLVLKLLLFGSMEKGLEFSLLSGWTVSSEEGIRPAVTEPISRSLAGHEGRGIPVAAPCQENRREVAGLGSAWVT